MMGINLRSVAAVTSLGGDLTFLDHVLNSYQSYLKYLEEKLARRRLKKKIALDVCKNVGHCIW